MYGALLGDMIGAPYEFDRGNKTKEFPLFCKYSHFTDDSVMTIAVAEALLDFRFREDEDIKAGLVESMRKWGKKYPNDGKMWLAAFTSDEEYRKGEAASIIDNFIGSMLEGCADMSDEGIIINPWGRSFLLTKDLIKLIIQVDKEGSAQ